MERLLTQTGGRPLKNEDVLEYLQAFTIIEQFFDDWNLGDCIVYGCDITGTVGNYTVSAGVIYYNGELRIFDGVAGVAFPLKLTTADIDINLREFEDGNNKYTAQIYKMVPDVGGAFDFDLTTPRTREQLLGPAGTKTKILQSGDWDMTTTLSLTLAHGLTFSKIVSVRGVIYIDDDAPQYPQAYNIGNAADGITPALGAVSAAAAIIWNDVNVIVSRLTGGYFDSGSFNKTPYNRAIILIEYLP
jgi:hypothetical protein